jgi:hypothetical protein
LGCREVLAGNACQTLLQHVTKISLPGGYMGRFLFGSVLACVIGAVVMFSPRAGFTQTQPERGYLYVCLSGPGSLPYPLDNQVVRISVLQEGELRQQVEARVQYPRFTACTPPSGGTSPIGLYLPVGMYEVRVDGPGAITEIKRGIPVLPSSTSPGSGVLFDLRPGDGTRVVEYEASSFSRDEITGRLNELNERLQKLEDIISQQ